MFLEHFRWVVFACCTVTSNAIPVFYNSFKCFQIFAGLSARRERILNFWCKISYAFITKANLIESVFTTNRSIVTLSLRVSFIKDIFIEFMFL